MPHSDYTTFIVGYDSHCHSFIVGYDSHIVDYVSDYVISLDKTLTWVPNMARLHVGS